MPHRVARRCGNVNLPAAARGPARRPSRAAAITDVLNGRISPVANEPERGTKSADREGGRGGPDRGTTRASGGRG
jgi:hypothetical protein